MEDDSEQVEEPLLSPRAQLIVALVWIATALVVAVDRIVRVRRRRTQARGK